MVNKFQDPECILDFANLQDNRLLKEISHFFPK